MENENKNINFILVNSLKMSREDTRYIFYLHVYLICALCVLGGGDRGYNNINYPEMLKYSPDFPTAVVNAVMS